VHYYERKVGASCSRNKLINNNSKFQHQESSLRRDRGERVFHRGGAAWPGGQRRFRRPVVGVRLPTVRPEENQVEHRQHQTSLEKRVHQEGG
jgi:hypothetical protein